MKKKEHDLWQRWETEVKKFEFARQDAPPDIISRHWQRYLLVVFQQELSRNVFDESQSLDSIIDRIMEGIRIGFGFRRIRFYLVTEFDEHSNVLQLHRISKNHGAIENNLLLKTEYGKDDAVDTLLTREPLAVDDASSLQLVYKELLKTKGPYAAIPLFVEKKPYGLICADSVSPGITSDTHKVNYIEYKEHFNTFAHTITSAIENWHISDRRNQKIKQFELVKEFNERIEAETEKDRLLHSFVEHCIKLVNADGGHLKLYNKESKKLERVAYFGADTAPRNITSKPKSIGFSNMVFKNKTALLINDLTRHPLMNQHKEYCRKKKYHDYLEILEHRKSALIVPLIKHTGEIYGVLDLHGLHKNQFSEKDQENLLALAGTVTYAVDKTQQLERRDELLSMRDQLLKMLEEAVGEAHSLNAVMEIIRKRCTKLLRLDKINIVCLLIKDTLTNELVPPSVKCVKENSEDCDLCCKKRPAIKEVMTAGKATFGKKDMAYPISLQDGEIIGVLYLQGEAEIELSENQETILDIISSTASILITTARNYEEKIKQSTAFYEAGKLNPGRRDFTEWFNPLMEKVLEIMGRPDRNFHLVMVEEENGEEKLVVKATSPLYKGREVISSADILGRNIPVTESLTGMVVKEKVCKYIPDVKTNTKQAYYSFNPHIKSEIGIPLRIKEGDNESVMGVLIIDSLKANDFQDFDWKFHQAIADYLATTIHNQQLYEERATFLEELSRMDRTTELSIFLNSFFHDIKNPLSEINSAINIIEMNSKEPVSLKCAKRLKKLSIQVLTTYDEFVNNFAKTVYKREQKGIHKLIINSLKTIEKTIGLDIEITGNYVDSDFRILCYPVFIELAFRSIIDNAIKYSRKLESSRRYLDIHVELGTEKEPVRIIFESSTCYSIPEDKLELIFKPFERVMSGEAGSGLGLSLANLCVKLHNGDINASNLEDKAAVRFVVTLPKARELIKGAGHEHHGF